MTQFDPPEHLSPRAKTLWSAVVPDRCRSPGRLALLQTALESLDRGDQAREAIAVTGMTSVTKTTGAIHVHPLVKVERESRAQFSRIWADLHLGFDPSIDGRSLEIFLRDQKALQDKLLGGTDADDDEPELPALPIKPTHRKRTTKPVGTKRS